MKVRSLLCALFVAVSLAGCKGSGEAVPKAGPASEVVSESCEKRVQSMDFSIQEVYKGPLAKPQLDREKTPDEWEYRTRIREGAVDGPNFGGRYTVVEWGCGTGCQWHAILEAGTGAVIGFGYDSSFGVRYSLASSLLVVNPAENAPSPVLPEWLEEIQRSERSYWRVADNKLELLCKENAATGLQLTK